MKAVREELAFYSLCVAFCKHLDLVTNTTNIFLREFKDTLIIFILLSSSFTTIKVSKCEGAFTFHLLSREESADVR